MRILSFLLLLLATGLQAAEWDTSYLVPKNQRARFRNPDGSCVQCSIGIAGVHHANENAEMLLWDSEYGHAERGASWPERVSGYARERGLEVWNITGPSTVRWIEWALSTGRYAAIGFDAAHFQTAVGMDSDRQTFYVVDNNNTSVVQRVPRSQFLARHHASGAWCVIIKGPAPPPWVGPTYAKWWPDSVPRKEDDDLGFDRSLF